MRRTTPPSRRTAAPAPAPPPRLRHPAFLVAILAAAASVVLSASYAIHDLDLWQLLVTGKAMWAQRELSHVDQWTWVGWGDPQSTSSWAFRAALWPMWSAGGVWGVFALRWVTVLAAFGLVWVAARRMGARGFSALVVIAACALAYRLRAEARPESFAAVLLAAWILVLETRRAGGPDRTAWLPLLACVWANVHLSWYLGFLVLGFHVVDDAWRARRLPRRLLLVGVASAAALFVNPYGWSALSQPFEFAFRWRNEPMFRNIVELFPVSWSAHRTDGLPLLVAAWPLLALWRARRRGLDLVEWLACVAFTAVGLGSQRFLGFYALVAAPYVARDLSEWLGASAWPEWTSRPWPRAALAAGLCLLPGIPEWSREELPLGLAVDPRIVPAAAGDFLEARGVRGRAFNHFHFGGYLAWRGWPERERLPFATTQPENLRPEIRARYPAAFTGAEGWRALDDAYAFDYVVLARDQDPGDRLLDVLGADPAWALVFTDDVAQVLVRRGGRNAAVAERFGYRELPPGAQARVALIPEVVADPARRERLAAELDRAIAGSPRHGSALHLRGMLRMMSERWDEARRDLEGAIAFDPDRPRVHELLGVTLEALGDRDAARRAYREELRRNPGAEEARARLARLGG